MISTIIAAIFITAGKASLASAQVGLCSDGTLPYYGNYASSNLASGYCTPNNLNFGCPSSFTCLPLSAGGYGCCRTGILPYERRINYAPTPLAANSFNSISTAGTNAYPYNAALYPTNGVQNSANFINNYSPYNTRDHTYPYAVGSSAGNAALYAVNPNSFGSYNGNGVNTLSNNFYSGLSSFGNTNNPSYMAGYPYSTIYGNGNLGFNGRKK